jgi:molybdopterin/thiamine biosynthesis adenylyltransferase
MARQTRIVASSDTQVIVRMAAPEFEELRSLVFRRYPNAEWATFARFGWHAAASTLVLTLAKVDAPSIGGLDERVDHVAIAEPYTLETALAAEQHPLAVGVIHSHPKDCPPCPSFIDDDMDGYYSGYFEGFAPGRPYVSLILSQMENELAISGRIWWRNRWLLVTRVVVERNPVQTWIGGRYPGKRPAAPERIARLTAALGHEASERLRRSTVAVIGAGGTGSAAIEVLARAGVGQLIIVDPDHLDESNLERVHGSRPEHADNKIAKVTLARDHVMSINPSCEVHAFLGALPQKEIVDAVVCADLALGCTDQQHSRLALSDLAVRYLVPSLDCGVLLEGDDGHITGQIVQITRFLAADPCALCRHIIVSTRVAQELMSDSERAQRQEAARLARERGEDDNPYWRNQPQLNTVGYLTTTAGAMVAGYAIGWLAGRFDPPFSRLQMNLAAKFLDVTNLEQSPQPGCVCRRVRGWSDQATADAMITPPSHWKPVEAL